MCHTAHIMITSIVSFFRKYPYSLPILAAFFSIISMPPFQVSLAFFFVFIPMFFYLRLCKSAIQAFLGGVLFSVVFASVITYAILSGFNWLDEAVLFIAYVKFLGWVLVCVTAIISGLLFAGLYLFNKHVHNPVIQMVFTVFILTVFEYMITTLLVGYHYGSSAYAAVEFDRLRIFATYGSTFLVSGVLVAIGILIGETLQALWSKSYKACLQVAVFLCVIFMLAQSGSKITASEYEDYVRVAIIQEQTRSDDAFGVVTDGVFSFPNLEKHIKEASEKNPDLIIYPLAPWSGVLSDTVDNLQFDRDVITISDDIFGNWLLKHVPKDVTFVTWYTTYREGVYANEIVYWKNGEVVGNYQKRKLFPFFDYVPEWAKKIGMYSLPYDGTAGTGNGSVVVDGVSYGNLVCSEVVFRKASYSNAQEAQVLLAIGSEALFSHRLPSEFNYMNAQFRATELGIPVVRANRFGPSAVFDATGKQTGYVPYGFEGVMVADVPIGRKGTQTLFGFFLQE